MIKVGDKVTLFSDITRNGIVVEVFYQKNETWFIGGTASKKTFAKVEFSKEDIRSYPMDQLMRLE